MADHSPCAGSLPRVPAKLEGKVATAPPRPSRTQSVPASELAATVDARLTSPAGAPVLVTGVTLRAQHVLPGDLFAALPGARAHGADFAAEAVRRGAVAVLTDEDGASRPELRDVPVLVHRDPRAALGALSARVYGEPAQRVALWGVTGTSGKTTTSYMQLGWKVLVPIALVWFVAVAFARYVRTEIEAGTLGAPTVLAVFGAVLAAALLVAFLLPDNRERVDPDAVPVTGGGFPVPPLDLAVPKPPPRRQVRVAELPDGSPAGSNGSAAKEPAAATTAKKEASDGDA